MAKQHHPNHYIREWRLYRGLSLRKLAARMEKEPGGAEIISHVSIGRIENGIQPYSQPILEALSVALNVSKSALLEVNPEKEGEVVDLMRRLPADKRDQAVEYLRFLVSK
jgi:transcriptional regulator with XRE-family HTH domain